MILNHKSSFYLSIHISTNENPSRSSWMSHAASKRRERLERAGDGTEHGYFPNSMRINCVAAVTAMMFRKQEVPVATVDW
ncbi:hypothetical protein Trydic_g19763 [Trypoxylus dichotomus]